MSSEVSPERRPGGKRKLELPKNAPSACNILGELDTRYREWPEEVVDILKHPSSLEPKRHRGPRVIIEPEVKITGEHLTETDEMRRLRDELAAKKREMLRMQREQELTENALRITASAKSNFELLKIMSTSPQKRTEAQSRHIHRAVALADSGPKRRYASTPTAMPPQPADSFDRHSQKRRVVAPTAASASTRERVMAGTPPVTAGATLTTIPQDSLPQMPTRDRPPRATSTGFPVMSAFAARTCVAGRQQPQNNPDRALGPLKRAVEEMAELAAKRKGRPQPKEVKFAATGSDRLQP